MNTIYKSLVCGNISLAVLDTADLVQKGMDIHGLTAGGAAVFGTLLTFTAYLGCNLKSPSGCVSVTVKSDDGSVSVSCDANLHVRGCVDGDAEKITDGGTLTVISEDGYSRPFIGTCLLEGGDLAEGLGNYFRQSEQVLTFIKIDCRVEGNKCLRCGAAIGSCLPQATAAQVEEFRQKLNSIEDISGAISAAGAQKFSADTFGGEWLSTLFPEYKCNCSEAKISQVLKACGKEELHSIIAERGVVSVHCHYCNKDYNFYREDIDKLF